MSKQSSRRYTEQERAQRRAQDRERLQHAARELLSSDGWARWVRTRAMFHSYSAGNCMLLAMQCYQRGIVPTRIAGFRTWLKLGRVVRKGETALRILPDRRASAWMTPVTDVTRSGSRGRGPAFATKQKHGEDAAFCSASRAYRDGVHVRQDPCPVTKAGSAGGTLPRAFDTSSATNPDRIPSARWPWLSGCG